MSRFLITLVCFTLNSCEMPASLSDLTHSAGGHTLHHQGVFSPDGQWVVFDGRNDDAKMGENDRIGIVNIETGEERIIYQTINPMIYGPGVGAASFHPFEDKVVFIHGLSDASVKFPYGVDRRTGVSADINNPGILTHLDARDTSFPYTAGALRGGSHAHSWSPDGRLISFTYNDALVESHLRTVGVMIPVNETVKVSIGGINGSMYSVLAADVVTEPEWGSDQIDKAFDEVWLSGDKREPYLIAFQGNTKNDSGDSVTEIFLVEINEDRIFTDNKTMENIGRRPQVPRSFTQKRLTHMSRGISDTRHWLRASKDGRFIYALAKDEKGINQIIKVSAVDGAIAWLTDNNHSIDFSFNLSPDESRAAYVFNNKLYLQNLRTGRVKILSSEEDIVSGVPSFSPNGKILVFNQFVRNKDGNIYLQIRKVCIGLY